MSFPRPSLLLTIWICWSGHLCLAQTPAKGFHWDWHTSEELTWKESISRSNTLSPRERDGLIKAVASQLRPNMSSESEQDLRKAAQTKIKAVDLSGQGTREFVAQSVGDQSCSPTGNCEFWVLRQNGDESSVILHRIATQTFAIQPTRTNGLHDLILGQHGSATDTGLTLYRFDGSKYRRVACFDANWEILGKDGEYHQLEKPRMTPTICQIR